MKSAYELAMERLGGRREYSEEQKAALAEIDRVHDAKRAEATLAADTKLKAVQGDPEKADAVRRDLAQELRRIEDKRESEKEKVRGG